MREPNGNLIDFFHRPSKQLGTHCWRFLNFAIVQKKKSKKSKKKSKFFFFKIQNSIFKIQNSKIGDNGFLDMEM